MRGRKVTLCSRMAQLKGQVRTPKRSSDSSLLLLSSVRQHWNCALFLAEPNQFLEVPWWSVGDLLHDSSVKRGACLTDAVMPQPYSTPSRVFTRQPLKLQQASEPSG
jgi:hypothetical protein